MCFCLIFLVFMCRDVSFKLVCIIPFSSSNEPRNKNIPKIATRQTQHIHSYCIAFWNQINIVHANRRFASGKYEKEATWTRTGEFRCRFRFIGHRQQCNICNGKSNSPIRTAKTVRRLKFKNRFQCIVIFAVCKNIIRLSIIETIGTPSWRSVSIRKIETVRSSYGTTKTTKLLSNVAIEIPHQVIILLKSHTRKIPYINRYK